MRPSIRSTRRSRDLVPVTLVLVAALAASCGASTERSPSATATGLDGSASPSAAVPPSPSQPAATPSPAVGSGPLTPGMLAVTVSDHLRVRSEPRVAASSIKYEPLLRTGTQLVVTGGPETGSNYTWIRVAPVGVQLAGGVDQGWVAVADHDGTPWVAPALDATPGFELAAADLGRPAADLAAARSEAGDLETFAVALYRAMLADPKLELDDSGVVFSPLSVATALTMARAGANGETAAEMDRLLGAAGWEALARGLGSLDQLLRSRDGSWQATDYGNDGQETLDTHWLALRLANMAFGQDGYPIEKAYLDRIGRTLGSGLGLVDYIDDTEAARAAINGWVSRQTMGRIPQLLAPGNVTGDTRLVLVNAVYLKAEWARRFDPAATETRAFTTSAGARVSVPTMSLYGGQDVPLATGAGWKATELAYKGPGGGTPLAMTLILPDSLDAFEAALTPATLTAVTAAIAKERATLWTETDGGPNGCGEYPYATHLLMPRFGVETRADLIPALSSLGMRLAFDTDRADFSGMTIADRLHIALVIHQANIDVDEEGTEAAAATAVGMDVGGCTGPEPATIRELRLDRPFLYLIRDTETGAILFMGRVTDPTSR